MPIFRRAALILKHGVIFVRFHMSYADRRTSYPRGSQYLRKSLTFSKGLDVGFARNHLTLRFHGRPISTTPQYPAPPICLYRQVSPREQRVETSL